MSPLTVYMTQTVWLPTYHPELLPDRSQQSQSCWNRKRIYPASKLIADKLKDTSQMLGVLPDPVPENGSYIRETLLF